MGPRFKFGDLQMKCMHEIAEGKKIAAVARDNGVHRATIHRWLKRPEVREYLEKAKEVEELFALARAMRRLNSTHPWRRLRAAQKITALSKKHFGFW